MREDVEQAQRKFFWNIGLNPDTSPTNEQFENTINKQLTGERRQFWLDEFRKETDDQIQAKLQEQVTHHTIDRELMGAPAEKNGKNSWEILVSILVKNQLKNKFRWRLTNKQGRTGANFG